MKPRIRLVVDNTRPPPPPRWIDINREEIVDRALYKLRGLRMSEAEKETLVREALDDPEDD